MTTLVTVLERYAAQTPSAPAVADPDVSWSHRELWQRVRQVGAALSRRGIGPGDTVGTALQPGAEHLAVLLGIMAAGAAAAPLNTKLAPAELARYLDAVRPGLVVGDAPTLPGSVEACGSASLADLDAEGWAPVPVDRDAAALVIGTGGTTGLPKGAVWSAGGLTSYLASSALVLEARRTDVELYFAPFFHVALATCGLSTLYAGGALLVEPRFDTARAVHLVQHGGVTRLFGPPTALNRLLGHPDFDPALTGSVRSVLFGSTASEPDLPRRLRAAFPDATLVTGYGATEFGAVTRLRSWETGDDLAGVGWPVPGAELRILDSEGCPVPDGEVGEIVVRAPWQMAGYLSGGRLEPAPATGIRSGDLASRTPDGRIRLRGRLKELVITGGENVFPVEVEHVLSEHDAVLEAAVLGVPDAEWGERVEAVVVLRDGDASSPLPSDEELLRHCRERLAGYKVPKRIVVRTHLPLTPTMKVDKRALKEWLREH